MAMSVDEHTPMDAASQRKLLADKKESEFNHHLTGFFVVLTGVFIFCEGVLTRRWPFLRFVWPSCFLLSGLFLLAFSDTELWPFGPQGWWYGLTHNPEDLQHKTFAAILLALGVLEIPRARGVPKIGMDSMDVPGDAPFSRTPHRDARCRAHDSDGTRPVPAPKFRCHQIRNWRSQSIVRTADSMERAVREALVTSDDRTRHPSYLLHRVTRLRIARSIASGLTTEQSAEVPG
jgi:hypothetical protein